METTSSRWLSMGLITLVAILIVVVFSTSMSTSSESMGVKTLSEPVTNQVVERYPRPMPVVGDFYSQGWDFRARNNEEQVIVITRSQEDFETKLFRIGAAINLCAHLGYAPPIILVESGRITDSAIPDTYRDMPELLQDIFPRLRFISVDNVDGGIKTLFKDSMVVKGSMKLFSEDRADFQEIPTTSCQTIVIDGSWESWVYLDDYRQSMFDHLEFHPIVYHHCRKTYPQLFVRKQLTRGIFIDNVSKIDIEEIRSFVNMSTDLNDKLLMFIPQPIGPKIIESIFGEDYKSRVSIVVGECKHVLIYLSIFCKDVLINLSRVNWWVGMHAIHRNKNVYYFGDEKVPLTDLCIHPLWMKNKK